MKLKSWQKNLLTIVSIIAGGFALLNLAFDVTALIIQGVMFIFQVDMTQAPSFKVLLVPAVIISILSSLTNEFADLIGAISGGIFLVLITSYIYAEATVDVLFYLSF